MVAVAHANPCAVADVIGIGGLAGVGTDPGPDPFEGDVLAGVVDVADPKDRAVARKRVIALPQPADDAVAVAGVPEAVADVPPTSTKLSGSWMRWLWVVCATSMAP
jgi:hypothetical protein